MPTPVLFDVDTGIDDALALLVATRSPELDLVGVGTIAGNVTASGAAFNTLRTLEAAGVTEVPVAVGVENFLLEPPHDASWIHGTDGIGDTDQPAPRGRPSGEHAVDQLLRLSHEHAGRLVVIATAPLTNLALAMRKDATLCDRLARIVIMGGSAQDGGNKAAWGEANIANDPEAAQVVFAADVPRTMIGLDVTMKVRFDQDDLEALTAASDPVANFAADLLPFYLGAYERVTGRRECAVHDALTVAAVIDPDAFTLRSLPTQVETRGDLTRGMTVVDLRARFANWPVGEQPRTDVALDVDVDRAHALLLERLGVRA